MSELLRKLVESVSWLPFNSVSKGAEAMNARRL